MSCMRKSDDDDKEVEMGSFCRIFSRAHLLQSVSKYFEKFLFDTLNPCIEGGEKEQKKRHLSKFPDPGVNTNRKCRDIFCLLLFTIFWGGMFICAAYGIQMGDLTRYALFVDSSHFGE
jgi:hypothetical protein